jgi:hypothetical protein
MKFKKQTMKANEIGKLFGASSHTVNKWLVQADLLDPKAKQPTWYAKNEGYSREVWANGFSHYEWVPQQVVPRLVELGHSLVSDLPSELVGDVQLTGPFRSDGTTVVNNQGVPVLLVSCLGNVDFVTAVMNSAHKTGAINRFFGKSCL